MESIRLQLELKKITDTYLQQRLFLTKHIDNWLETTELEIAVSNHDIRDFVIQDVIEYYQTHRRIALTIEAQIKLQDYAETKLYTVACASLDKSM